MTLAPPGTDPVRLERELLDAAADAPTRRSVGLRPVPPPDPEAARDALDQAFDAWARQVIAAWNDHHTDHAPFDLADFDGCTYAPDLVRPCCLIHDLGVRVATTRRERLAADRAFRRCILARRRWESPLWAWSWTVRAWIFWGGVAVFGLLTFRPPRRPP